MTPDEALSRNSHFTCSLDLRALDSFAQCSTYPFGIANGTIVTDLSNRELTMALARSAPFIIVVTVAVAIAVAVAAAVIIIIIMIVADVTG